MTLSLTACVTFHLSTPVYLYRLSASITAIFICFQYCTPVSAEQIFVDVTESAGLTFVHTDGRSGVRLFNEFLGSGGGFFDYDNDGDLDIYLVNGAIQTDNPNPSNSAQPNTLYRNNGDGTFTDITEETGVGSTAYGTGATVGDYDNDGDLDSTLLTSVRINSTKTTETARSRISQPRLGSVTHNGVPVALSPMSITTDTWTFTSLTMPYIHQRMTSDVKNGAFTSTVAPTRIPQFTILSIKTTATVGS